MDCFFLFRFASDDECGFDREREVHVLPLLVDNSHDLLSDARYLWHGRRNFVELAPGMGHIFAVRRKVRDEHDFDYFF